jgi:membrane associated rhomboid family serine protease
MAYHDRDYARRDCASAPSLTPVVRGLIVINIAVFVGQIICQHFLGIPLQVYLGLVPPFLLKGWLWQLFTYMFLHNVFGIFHIIFNMLFLYWFGRELELIHGRRWFLTFYLTAGIAAGLAYCAFTPLIQAPVIGASGAVMGVLVVYTLYYPNQTILFMLLVPMKLKHFTLLILGLDLYYSVLYLSNGVANVAHLGGAAFGFLVVKTGPALERYLQSLAERRARSAEIDREWERQRVDELLDKINREGMAKLSRRERKFLMEASRKYRGR